MKDITKGSILLNKSTGVKHIVLDIIGGYADVTVYQSLAPIREFEVKDLTNHFELVTLVSEGINCPFETNFLI